MKTTEKSYIGWYFLFLVMLGYLLTFIVDSSKVFLAFGEFWNILQSILFVLVILIVFTTIINYYVNSDLLVKYMGKNSGVKGVLIAIVSGIISTGPIYMWYPLLSDLQDKGVKTSLIAIFLYNRAIKIPLLPMLLVYFSLKYVVILSLVMIVMSIIQGYIIERLENW